MDIVSPADTVSSWDRLVQTAKTEIKSLVTMLQPLAPTQWVDQIRIRSGKSLQTRGMGTGYRAGFPPLRKSDGVGRIMMSICLTIQLKINLDLVQKLLLHKTSAHLVPPQIYPPTTLALLTPAQLAPIWHKMHHASTKTQPSHQSVLKWPMATMCIRQPHASLHGKICQKAQQ